MYTNVEILVVSEFAKKTGDYAVLSSTDLQILALTYEIESEKNGDNWRQRLASTTKTSDHKSEPESNSDTSIAVSVDQASASLADLSVSKEIRENSTLESKREDANNDEWSTVARKTRSKKKTRTNYRPQKEFAGPRTFAPVPEPVLEEVPAALADPYPLLSEEVDTDIGPEDAVDADEGENSHTSDEDDDGEGWITPETLHHQQVLDGTLEPNVPAEEQPVLSVGMASGDFAMQNVALQIGLNVINPRSGFQIRKIRSWMLRCHACFFLTAPPMGAKPRQFCPRCGGATLLRCTVTTSADTGKVQIHLKKNFQWSHRGNKYSLPNPQSKHNRKTGGEGAEEILLR